ncbi:uncharacterized protein LOC114754051 [Neltuma alba]|uniref:uncharacterized protein LOC114754051 n=1 Tax=Neltuma alba TaxID=207710 RepID=UPI0010A3700A|nr:uncharacterized protein LOC114754051 [Prosopis alba]
MKMIAWNCQGLGRTLTVKKLREECLKNKPSIIFLMETKIKGEKVKRIRRLCQMQEEFYVDPRGRGGGLALWWKEDVIVNIWFNSRNLIHVSLESNSFTVPKYVTFVYGAPGNDKKMLVWNEMRRLGSGVRGSWLCLGDFNDVISEEEKWGNLPIDIGRAINFQCMLADCHLIDLGFKGAKYTWCNKRLGAAQVKERLDRAVANVEFREDFHNATVIHIEPVGSDHHMLLMDCDFQHSRVPKMFRFEAFWAEYIDFLNVVRQGWKQTRGNGNKVEVLIDRLDECRKVLLKWSRETFPNARRQVEQLTQKLKECTSGSLNEQSRAEAESLIQQIEEAWDREEKYWWQRSRVNWLQDGDRNTKFFHSSTIQRRIKNKVTKLKSDDGRWLEEENEVNDAFLKFYSSLFSSTGCKNMQVALFFVKNSVMAEDNERLEGRVSLEEIKMAAFQLNGAKAPGPDGYSGMFYQSSWNIVSKEVVEMVFDFFEGKVSLKNLNRTNVVLIPKVEHAENVGQFRPIGLCNFAYKIVSKILANRLKNLMKKVISENQRAFVTGRLIQDNILVSHEAFHYLKNKKKGKKMEMAVKIDMNKAYDRLEWNLLKR